MVGSGCGGFVNSCMAFFLDLKRGCRYNRWLLDAGLEMADRKFSTVAKILFMQILTVILIASGFFFVGGRDDVLSPLLGGLAAFLPNLYFALRTTRATAADAQSIVRSFYAGETGKLILTAALFYIIFQLPDIKILPLLAAYAAVLSTFWFALILRSD